MQLQQIPCQISTDSKKRIALSAGAGSLLLLASATPSHAAAPSDVTSAVTDISATMTALGGLATAALAVVLVPMGIKYGLGFAKQVMSKG